MAGKMKLEKSNVDELLDLKIKGGFRTRTPIEFSGIVPDLDLDFIDTWNTWEEKKKFRYLFYLEKDSISRGFYSGIALGLILGLIMVALFRYL
jgi:hypothetical protein